MAVPTPRRLAGVQGVEFLILGPCLKEKAWEKENVPKTLIKK